MFPGEQTAFPSAKVHEEARQKGASVIYIFLTEALLQSAAFFSCADGCFAPLQRANMK